jgi:nondiscriminating glutamyl-tRNA synthetase
MENLPTEIRVRIAPSPTGLLHFGTARTALFNWLFARHMGGKFILRIEDTDTERSTKAFEDDIVTGLRWLGLQWDEGPDVGGPYGPYRQSERLPIYQKYLKQLLDADKAYHCFCSKEQLDADRQAMQQQGATPVYVGRCSTLSHTEQSARIANGDQSVIRLRVPAGAIEFHDIIRDTVSVQSELIGDVIIARSMDLPLFILAGVIDDHEMKISHVIRGEDHISNTPKQTALQHALGFPVPEYAHLPLILAPDRSKLSKRYIETSLNDFKGQGYLPEALVNFMAFIGWHPKDDTEVMTSDDLIREFDIARVQKGGGVFNLEKLEWLNAQYIKRLPVDALIEALAPFVPAAWMEQRDLLRRIAAVEQERLKRLTDFTEVAGFFFELPDYAPSTLIWKEATPAVVKENLSAVQEVLGLLADEAFTKEGLEQALMPLAEQRGRGDILWPLRVALSGQKASPGPFDIMPALGKEESMRRISDGIRKL